jgi:putrescine aminotransferase
MTTLRRNYDKQRLVALDTAHHLHPFTDHKSLHGEGGARIITHAEGCWLSDADGNRILDGMAGLWCVNVGYGREELAKVAYDQMLELPYYNAFFKTASPPVVELSAKLAAVMPEGINRAYFGNSGSESNDTMLRLVRWFWAMQGKPYKKWVVARHNAYHGSTVAGASLGGMKVMHGQGDLPIPGIAHVQQPYWFGEGGDMSPEEFGRHAALQVERKILELGAHNVAAFIGEPIQGAGGVIIPPETYWPEIQRICREHDVLLVSDEVICGFGRTGEWFGCQSFGFQPDLMTMAKGLSSGYQPISALGVSDRIAEVLLDKGGEFFHGYTYSGHPVACAVALRNIEILEREGLVERTRTETGPYLKRALEGLADHPIVGEVRSRGLIGAIELVKDKRTRRRFREIGKAGTICRDNFFRRNAIMRACGDTMVVSPPLIVSTGEIDTLIATARDCLDATWAEVKEW